MHRHSLYSRVINYNLDALFGGSSWVVTCFWPSDEGLPDVSDMVPGDKILPGLLLNVLYCICYSKGSTQKVGVSRRYRFGSLNKKKSRLNASSYSGRLVSDLA